MNIILLGYPGAGKGTEAENLKKRGYFHVSTGDLIRAEIKKESPLGKQVKDLISKGNLVPDALITEILLSAIKGKENILFDGFPRTLAQAQTLTKYLQDAGQKVKVILLKASEEVVLKRLTSRRLCKDCGHIENIYWPSYTGKCSKCGGELYTRPDDTLESAKHRLDVFRKETEPLLEYYSKQAGYITVDASRSAEEVSLTVKRALEV